ncbi:MAG: hypothetical protein AAF871_15470 [Pseudomonadota bacterium]
MFMKHLLRKAQPTPVPGMPLDDADRATTPAAAVHRAVVEMPIKLSDDALAEEFSQPLRTTLLERGLGDVVGHKVKPGREDEPKGVEIRLVLVSKHPNILRTVGAMLDGMAAPVGSTITFVDSEQRHLFGRTEGVAVDIDKRQDWQGLAADLSDALGPLGDYRGARERGPLRSLYFYGESFAAMQAKMAATSPMAARARRLT